MTIYVNSLDFDGCVLNIKVYDSLQTNSMNQMHSNTELSFDQIIFDFYDNNAILLTALQSQMGEESFEKMILLVGSNRQSYAVDQSNKNNTGYSCFPVIKAISDIMGATFDPFLLADVYGNLPSGSAFQQAMQQEQSKIKKQHANYVFDHTKTSILYAQMHKVASEHPEENIEFNFFDDRADILDALIRFYSEAKDLIPAGVTLKLHLYDGLQLESLCIIEGTGTIDTHYRKSIKEMCKQTQRGTYLTQVECNIAEELNVDKFRKYKDSVISTFECSFDDVLLSLEYMNHHTFITALKLIESTLDPQHREQSLLSKYLKQALEIGDEYYYNFAPSYNEIVNIVRIENNMIHSGSKTEWDTYRASLDLSMRKIKKLLEEIHLQRDPIMLAKLEEIKTLRLQDIPCSKPTDDQSYKKTPMKFRLHLEDFKPGLPFRYDYSSIPIDYHSYKVALKVLKVALEAYAYKHPQHKEIVCQFIENCILQVEWLDKDLDYPKLLNLIVEKLEIQLDQFFSTKLPMEWIDAGNHRLFQCEEEIDELVNFLQKKPLQECPLVQMNKITEQNLNELLCNQSIFQPTEAAQTAVDPSLSYEEAYVAPGLSYSSSDFY